MTNDTLQAESATVQSDAPSCGNCRFFHWDGPATDHQGSEGGDCRFNPPAPRFGHTMRYQWCGKHELTLSADDQHTEDQKDILRYAARYAREARLPGHYQWGRDAMESFKVGKERAALAILAVIGE